MTIVLPQFRGMVGGGGLGSSTDPYFSYVKYLWHADGTDGDVGPYTPTVGATVTAGTGASLKTAQHVFGTASARITGTGSANTISSTSSTYKPGTSDFVLEGWCRPDSVPGGGANIIDMRPSANGAYISVGINGSLGWQLYVSSSVKITSTGNVTNGAWNYFCLARTSGTTRLYAGSLGGGTAPQVGSSYTDSNNYNSSGSVPIYHGGSSFGSGTACYIDDVRLTIGHGRGYTGSSVPVPIAPFPNS